MLLVDLRLDDGKFETTGSLYYVAIMRRCIYQVPRPAYRFIITYNKSTFDHVSIDDFKAHGSGGGSYRYLSLRTRICREYVRPV